MVVLSIVILVFGGVLRFFSNTAGHTLQGTSHFFPSLEMENHRLKFVPLQISVNEDSHPIPVPLTLGLLEISYYHVEIGWFKFFPSTGCFITVAKMIKQENIMKWYPTTSYS